jgi:hypothetical protein
MVRRLLWILVMWFTLPALAAVSPPVAVLSPRPGEALQGVITITGSTAVDGFTSMEVSFAYHGDTGRTWFLIQESQQPVSGGALATWDTTTITDGDYDLRLLVSLKDGVQQQVVVSGLRVRNYTPVETLTPTPFVPEATPLPSATTTATPYPTPTALSPNPVTITMADVVVNVGYGSLVVLLLFAFLGAYLWLRRK